MGCDFELEIQVLYGSYWVTIVEFGCKTSCGGFPLCSAMFDAAKEGRIVGDYGLQYPTSTDDFDQMFMLKKRKDFVHKIETETITAKQCAVGITATCDRNDTVKVLLDEIEDTKVEEEEEDEFSEKYREKQFLYYSKDQFTELIEYIQPISDRGRPYLYIEIMEPVPKWCELTLTSMPLGCGEIWMSEEPEEIEKVTQLIVEKQAEMLILFKNSLVETLADLSLPLELVHLIAEYAVGGKDVRVAFKDEEGHSQSIRAGNLTESRCDNTDKCVVM